MYSSLQLEVESTLLSFPLNRVTCLPDVDRISGLEHYNDEGTSSHEIGPSMVGWPYHAWVLGLLLCSWSLRMIVWQKTNLFFWSYAQLNPLGEMSRLLLFFLCLSFDRAVVVRAFNLPLLKSSSSVKKSVVRAQRALLGLPSIPCALEDDWPWRHPPCSSCSRPPPGHVGGRSKGKLLYSIVEIEADVGCASVDGGVGSIQKRMT